MTVWKKTVLSVSLTFLILTIMLYFFTQSIMLKSFIDHEAQMASENVNRALNALNNDIDTLETSVIDWAYWDDSYEFANNLNNAYIKSNLPILTFPEINIDLIIYLDPMGKIAFKMSVDKEMEKEIELPQSLLPLITPESILNRHSKEGGMNGFLLLDEGPIFISAYPILTSENKGPDRGTLIMARYLDSAGLKDIAERTRLSLHIHSIESKDMPEKFLEAKRHLTDESPIFVNPISEEYIMGVLPAERHLWQTHFTHRF